MNLLTRSGVARGFVLLALGSIGFAPSAVAQETTNNKIPLSVLYAGRPGSPREADFVGFLRQHFREVQTGDFAKFAARSATNVDVVLLDWDGDGFRAPRVTIPDDYSKPTVTLSVAGGLLCSQLRLKTGYL